MIYCKQQKSFAGVRHRGSRAGIGQLEIIVAATILGLLTGLFSTMSYQIQRIHKDARHYQLAVFELGNHLRRLGSLSPEAAAAEIANIKVSDVALQRLEGVQLRGRLIKDNLGDRVELEINWNRIGSPEPIRMTAWLTTQPVVLDSAAPSNTGADT